MYTENIIKNNIKESLKKIESFLYVQNHKLFEVSQLDIGDFEFDDESGLYSLFLDLVIKSEISPEELTNHMMDIESSLYKSLSMLSLNKEGKITSSKNIEKVSFINYIIFKVNFNYITDSELNMELSLHFG